MARAKRPRSNSNKDQQFVDSALQCGALPGPALFEVTQRTLGRMLSAMSGEPERACVMHIAALFGRSAAKKKVTAAEWEAAEAAAFDVYRASGDRSVRQAQIAAQWAHEAVQTKNAERVAWAATAAIEWANQLTGSARAAEFAQIAQDVRTVSIAATKPRTTRARTRR